MYGMYAACVSENKLFSEIIKKKVWNEKSVIWKKEGEKRKEWAAASVVD